MTLAEVYNLRAGGSWLRNRAIAAIGNLAAYYAGLGAGATADQQAFVARVLPGTNAEVEAEFIMWALCFDGTVQASGEAITDESLKAVVQTQLEALHRIQAV